MPEKLIIYLHSSDIEHPSWAVIGEAGVRQYAWHDSADGLSAIAEEKEVIVLVPAEDALLTVAHIPKMNRSRLQQALPYALEEQLIDDVNTLHFAAGDYLPDDQLPVVIVAKEKMQQWRDLLQSWNIQADILMPAIFALPYADNHWQVLVDDMAMVRMNAFQGFACDNNNLPELLKLALDASSPRPELIQVNYYGEPLQKMNLNIAVNEMNAEPAQSIINLAQNVEKYPKINLLQGVYAVKKARLPHKDKLFQLLGRLAVAWIALIFLYPGVSFFILKHKLNALDEQIDQIYHRNFPRAASIVAPKIRMQDKLQKLSSQMGGNRLLLMMGYIGQAMQNTDIKLTRLNYQGSQLTIELSALSAENFSTFIDLLTQHGLSVKQQNANLNGKKINATLLIE